LVAGGRIKGAYLSGITAAGILLAAADQQGKQL
jgi:hypothetical protein